ncbi:MAG: molybdopterin converting factor subunit 1 [Candidatus Solibacter usitatus]|nr:molybdopterin converting factor subunit 1 [Candidatus Solibacter usitatus]
MTLSVTIRILFFGMLKDITGRASDSLEMPEGATAGAVFDHYASAFPPLDTARRSIVVAVNQQFAARDQTLRDGDEIALLPPVSGGTGPYTHVLEDPAGHFFALTRRPIDIPALRARALTPEDGAIVVFEGVVRNNSGGRRTLFLDYEGYEPMAVEVMARIGRDIAGTSRITRIAIVHRLGRMEIGEASVVVLVTAPHRVAAFAAALEGINRLKKLVPVWKKEHFADGEVWVEGAWDPSVAEL